MLCSTYSRILKSITEQTPIVKEDKFFSQADVVLTGKNVLKNVLFTDIFTGFIKI